MSIEQLGAQEAKERVASGAFLLDVREDNEWLAGHAPTATHIPLSQVGDAIDDLPLDRQIICVCRMGGRSQNAAQRLTAGGLDAVNLAGGMTAWMAGGLEMTAENGGEPRVL